MQINLSGRQLSLLLLISFSFGTLFGYQLKTYRLQYLKRKRDRFARKLFDTERQIERTIDKSSSFLF
jgi:hypothetical protein